MSKEFSKFERLTAQILAVPHDLIKKRLDEEKAAMVCSIDSPEDCVMCGS